MKTHLFKLRIQLLVLFFLGTNLFLNAQSMRISNTNAKEYSYNASTKTHTVKLPFYENSFTGTFIMLKDGANYCTSPGSLLNLNLYNNATGNIIANNSNGNNPFVSFPYSFPVGTTYLRLSSSCYIPSQPNTPITNIVVSVVVTKEPNPILNIVFTPFCQKAKLTNINTGYFSYKATGTASNVTGLDIKVTKLSNNSSQLFPLSSFLNPPPSNVLIPTTFYSSNTNGTYKISLQYKYNRITSNYPFFTSANTVYDIPTPNNYGWTNHVWTKTYNTCPITEVPVGPIETGKSSTQDLTIEVENKSNVKNLKVFPNPTTGTINFEPSSEDIIVKQINVYDTTNLLLFSKEINSVGKQSLDLSNLKEGIYMLQIETDRGIEITKIIKNN